MPQVNEKVKKIRADILRRESKKLLHKKLNKTIGKCRRILFESHGKSYTDEFFKVKLTGKKNFDSQPGVVLDINVISRNDDTLVAELI
jgi:tRNA A37 methylthiotransferase MiaB